MSDHLAERIAAELQIPIAGVSRTIELLDDDNTIPFISRYRKEATGGLDEVCVEAIKRRLGALRILEARRADVFRHIDEQAKMTPDLAAAIASAETLQSLEDLYLPFRPKRRTRAMIARERGLEPLAHLVLDQVGGGRNALAGPFVDPDRDVPTIDDALAGARDIVAETIAEDADVRGALRQLYAAAGEIRAAVADPHKDAARTYEQYYDFHGSLAGMPPHRILAINRGEREGVLRASVSAPEDSTLGIVARYYPPHGSSGFADDLRHACSDSLTRLIGPSLEREMRANLTDRAEMHATNVFAMNLKPLLLQPPLRGKTIVGIDPGFRTGCKVAVVDETGKVLTTTVIYPHPPQMKRVEAKSTLKNLARMYGATVFAVGSGTAGRETEEMVSELIAGLENAASYAIVDEAGASVYSVSEIAREEFPDLEATDRGAISIARRLQDPLAELVKVDPRSVGVGLYQHDIDQTALCGALDRVVESAVTFAGVDINTASAPLLYRVAGLNRKVAASIVRYREQHGKFTSKHDLSKVQGLGPRAFQQAAGFLKVPDSANILDRTFIHPESYAAALRLIGNFPEPLPNEQFSARAARFASRLATTPGERSRIALQLGIGEPTLVDLLDNLAKPGIDPRSALPPPLMRTGAMTLDDLQPGVVLQGTVRNVVDFGAFVDIGLKQAGLVHVSEMADRFVKSALDVVSVGNVVSVRVLSVDVTRGRISLSLRTARG